MKNQILNAGINLLRIAKEFNSALNDAENLINTMSKEDKKLLQNDTQIVEQQNEIMKIFDEISSKI